MLYWISAAISVVGILFFFSVGVLTCWRYFVTWWKDRHSLCEF